MKLHLRGVVVMGILSGILAACAGEPPSNLGVKGGLLAACPSSPNCVSSQANSVKHRIAPLVFRGDPNAAFARLKLVLGQRGDATIIENMPGYLRVELRTLLFVDDGEFLLDPTRHVIHLRSSSRLGYSDLGKNRSRIEAIRTKFSSEDKNP